MNKEELEKEAEENSFRYTLDKPWVCEVERKQIMAHFEKGYLAGAEPREKRIEELEKENKLLGERCNQLLKDKGDLTDTNSRLLSQVAATTKKVIELEKKIEELEQKIKWHDLRKDPKDLPGEDDYQILITYVEYNHKWVTLGHYDQDTNKWFTNMELPLKKVIAWKKIIKLDEDVI